MSDHVEGLVAKISEKAAGKGTVYNVCLEIDGQDDEWFGHGFDKPKFNEGDFIEFAIEYNGDYSNVDKRSVNIIEEGEEKPARSSGRGRSSGGGRGGSSGRSSGRSSGGSSRGGSKPASKARGAKPAAKSDGLSKSEWADKDKMIRRQACMNTSIKLVTLLFAEGAVSIPKKKADAYDAVVELCNEEAERLYDQYEEQVYGGGSSKRGNTRGRNNDYDDDIPE